MKLFKSIIFICLFFYPSLTQANNSNLLEDLQFHNTERSLQANKKKIDLLVEATSYRVANDLCYVFTYNNGTGHTPGVMDIMDVYNPLIRDQRYKNGLMQWLSLEHEAFRNTLFGQNSNSHDTDELDDTDELFVLNTNYVQSLIDTEGFSDAIEDCAKENNLDSEQLHKEIKDAILRVDMSRVVDAYAVEWVAIGGVTGKLFSVLKRGLSLSKTLIQSAGFYRWLRRTRVMQALRRRITFLQRLKWRLGAGAAGVSSILFQKGDSPYEQIHQQNTIQNTIAATQRGNEVATGVEEFAKSLSSMTLEEQFWIRRTSMYTSMLAYLNKIKSTEEVRYNMPKRLYVEMLWQCDPSIEVMKDFCKILNIYVVDYWNVKRKLDGYLGRNIYGNENAMLYNKIKGMFTLRKELLEREVAQGDQRKAITLRLIRRSENDPNFMCIFNDATVTDPLCRLHYLYSIDSFNFLTPAMSEELKQLEDTLL